MGAIASRQNAGVEEVDIGINHAYRYPPKTGNYFSGHFIMGGERFDTAQPETYLFGENTDLNFLGSRPAPFPYPAPTAGEPSKTLKALINIRKESLRFVRTPDDSLGLKEPDDRTLPQRFNIEFTFDCDVRCSITIMYFCSEDVTSTSLNYSPRDPSMNSETYHYKRGVNQQFSQVCHVLEPSNYTEEDLIYSFERELMPIVIYCSAEEGEEPRQAHSTIAVVEKHSDGFIMKPLKQKLFVDGLCYLLQEIYGIENKNTDTSKIATEEETEDNGAECVICMCDLRDTLILPCRHLCLCNCCADSLRYQANNCPICRAPFRALLQIKALQKCTGTTNNMATTTEGSDNIPNGYEAVPLIEALNGPSVAPQQPTAPPCQEMYVQLPQSPEGLPDAEEASRSAPGGQEDSTTQTDQLTNSSESNTTLPVSEMRMSVLLAQELEEVAPVKPEPPLPVSNKKRAARKTSREKPSYGSKDSVKIVNEVGAKEPADPTETRSLLDEEPTDSVAVTHSPLNASSRASSSLITLDQSPPEELRAPQAVAECVDMEDEEEPVCISLGKGYNENKNHRVAEDLEDIADIDAAMDELERETCFSPEFTAVKPIQKPPRKIREKPTHHAFSKTSRHGSPATSVASHESLSGSSNLPIEPISLPGTPLSNSSVISHSSDASVSSASSTRALLFSHPTQPAEGSVV